MKKWCVAYALNTKATHSFYEGKVMRGYFNLLLIQKICL